MKKILVILALVFPLMVIGQTQTENYIKTTHYQTEEQNENTTLENDEKIESITYYDGLGRPKQNIAIRAGGNNQDIITPIVYDEFGRQAKEYLPYSNVSQQNSSQHYRDNNSLINNLNNYYTSKHSEDIEVNNENPYSEKVFEPSPLNRVEKQGAPGFAWKANLDNNLDHTIKYKYNLNTPEDEVKKFEVVFTNGVASLNLNEDYQTNSLYKNIIKNENWKQSDGNNNTVHEFKNDLGRVILKRSFNENEPHDVYYVYDNYGNLIYVIPPLASDNVFELITKPRPYVYNQSISIYDLLINDDGNPVSGGGSVRITIENSELNIIFGGGFTQATIDVTKTYPINAIHPIPDMNLGYLDVNEQSNRYTVYIENNQIKFIDNNPGTSGFSGFNHTFIKPLDSSLFSSVITDELELNEAILENLCYQYKYDKRNRLIEKKIPGKEKEYIVYNKLDQPVLTQDANLRKNHQWFFSKYDAFGRVVYTGVYTHTGEATQSEMQTELNAHYAGENPPKQFEEKLGSEGSYHYYSNVTFPTANLELLTVNYYDNHTFNKVGLTLPTGSIYEQAIATNVKGLATGAKVRVLGTNNWITTITVYDKKGRAIYVAGKNDYLGTTDIVQTKYDFTGKILKTRTRHQKGSEGEIVTLDVFTYDQAGRLKTQVQCIGDDCNDVATKANLTFNATVSTTQNHVAFNSITLSPGFHVVATSNLSFSAKIEPGGELITENTYDELGQLVQKKVGGSNGAGGLQTIDYSYNIRGWLKQINNPASLGTDLFGFAINYNVPTESLGATALYNGNISETIWKTANDNVKRAYGYQYDALNRITIATGNSNASYYNLGSTTNPVEYDKNGNITKLFRKGHTNEAATSFGTMDILDYGYDNGNKLVKVTDTGNTSYGFKDGANTNDDFEYDANGNLKIDRNKGITNIAYNHLNLPVQVDINNNTDNGTISYIYDAAGMKLRKIAVDNNTSITTTTDYAGNYIYKNGSLKMFFHPEGYFDVTGTPPSGELEGAYVYQYKDHLGNIRLSYSDSDNNGIISANAEIIEENNYYPFGLKHKGYNNNVSANANSVASKFKFGGKELSEELGLNTYDFGARNYDPAIGRWMNLDPLAEKMRRHSPYNYAFNNPINFTDPDGMAPWWINNGDGTWTAEAGDSAWSLAQDAGISAEEANKIVESQLGSNYIGEDGQLKSDVEVGDVVTVTNFSDKSNSTPNESSVNISESESSPALSFEKGQEVNMKVTSKTWGEITAGPLGANYNQLSIEYNGEKIESSGVATGAGLGTEFLTKTGGDTVTFHTDMSGGSLLEVFNQTGLTISKSGGAVVSFGTITGYDSAQKMNKLWSVKVRGSGLKGGVSSDRSTAPFKEKNKK
ncbi:DUF6443 domain-containing protein [Abyssalbus ytuae]|uniref:RHS repeat-associated core domain-containing protein n=1 Tax=Abyssalbus ytuae TaxID=2926907 RepID=A0A9E7D3I5_9FLAO|nr:DUF6443 domain-containing protein [Abyssalbus ytuae]UOB17889.1 RHS repeat-associated core domain-containing protein [Abyssalbus ytuae]